MDDRISSIGIITLGALIVLASLSADMIGLGYHAGFGPKQAMGAVFGIIVLAIGTDIFKSSGTGNTGAQ